MRRLTALVAIATLALGAIGCSGSDQPKKDAAGNAAKAPDVPPTGP